MFSILLVLETPHGGVLLGDPVPHHLDLVLLTLQYNITFIITSWKKWKSVKKTAVVVTILKNKESSGGRGKNLPYWPK